MVVDEMNEEGIAYGRPIEMNQSREYGNQNVSSISNGIDYGRSPHHKLKESFMLLLYVPPPPRPVLTIIPSPSRLRLFFQQEQLCCGRRCFLWRRIKISILQLLARHVETFLRIVGVRVARSSVKEVSVVVAVLVCIYIR